MMKENQEKFESVCGIIQSMHKSKKKYAADDFTDLLLEAIACGPPEFAMYMQQQLVEIINMPPLQHFIAEGLPIRSLEEAVHYYKRTEEILNATFLRLGKMSPYHYAASPPKSSMH